MGNNILEDAKEHIEELKEYFYKNNYKNKWGVNFSQLQDWQIEGLYVEKVSEEYFENLSKQGQILYISDNKGDIYKKMPNGELIRCPN